MEPALHTKLNKFLHIGTRSVLFGVHSLLTHPFFVWLAYCRLEKFTLNPPVLFACLLHDIGYIGKEDFDGPEGKTHPELGAKIMHFLFDGNHVADARTDFLFCKHCGTSMLGSASRCFKWHDFTLFHSRSYAKMAGKPVSPLCVADKLALVITPRWLYLFQAKLTGEIEYFYENAANYEGSDFPTADYHGRPVEWYDELSKHMLRYISECYPKYVKDHDPEPVKEQPWSFRTNLFMGSTGDYERAAPISLYVPNYSQWSRWMKLLGNVGMVSMGIIIALGLLSALFVLVTE